METIDFERLRAIIRGHLLSYDKLPKQLNKEGNEQFVTKHYSVIVTPFNVSFKKGSKVYNFQYDEIKKFYIEDCRSFVFIRKGQKQKCKFAIY